MMSTYETLTLMVTFAMLVAVIINGQKKDTLWHQDI